VSNNLSILLQVLSKSKFEPGLYIFEVGCQQMIQDNLYFQVSYFSPWEILKKLAKKLFDRLSRHENWKTESWQLGFRGWICLGVGEFFLQLIRSSKIVKQYFIH